MDSEALKALAPVLILVVAFVGHCLVADFRSDAPMATRFIWAAAMVAFVPLGSVAYLLFGRSPRRSVPEPAYALSLARVESSFEPSPGGPLATTDLAKSYGSTSALGGVDVDVPAGSVYGLVGPNGAGKTTLIALLAGLRKPSSGSVQLPPGRVAVMPDTPEFDPWLTAREVVGLASTLLGTGQGSRRSDAARVEESLAEVGLLELGNTRVGGFSRGMLQRLGIAATVVGGPEVLLLDEPCSALDPVGRKDVLDLVARLGRASTVLFSSHILSDVERVCDHIGVLGRGHLVYQGPLSELSSAATAYAIRFRSLSDRVVAALDAAEFVSAVERSGDELRVQVTSLDEAERGLVKVLAESGAVVVSMEPLGRGLEEVFLELTQGVGQAP